MINYQEKVYTVPMKKTSAVLAILAISASLTLTACGSDTTQVSCNSAAQIGSLQADTASFVTKGGGGGGHASSGGGHSSSSSHSGTSAKTAPRSGTSTVRTPPRVTVIRTPPPVYIRVRTPMMPYVPYYYGYHPAFMPFFMLHGGMPYGMQTQTTNVQCPTSAPTGS